MARFTPETTLLIQGIKAKINEQGEVLDDVTRDEVKNFADAFRALIDR